MTTNERIKYLRKEILKLNQKNFADKIGMKQTSVSTFEQNGATITEQTKTSICTIFNISRKWLDSGIEPIFNETKNFELDKFARSKGATELEIEILKAYFDMNENLRKQMINHFISYFQNNNVHDDTYDKAKEFADKNIKESNSLNINDKNIKTL